MSISDKATQAYHKDMQQRMESSGELIGRLKLTIHRQIHLMMSYLGELDGHAMESYQESSDRLRTSNRSASDYIRYLDQAYRCLDDIDMLQELSKPRKSDATNPGHKRVAIANKWRTGK